MRFLKTLEHQHVKPFLRRMRLYGEVAYAGVRVSTKRHLDGGGSTFGQDFIPLLRKRGMPKAKRALRVVFEQDAAHERTKEPRMFYLGIMRQGDIAPAWAA